jgi:hypothetical protein
MFLNICSTDAEVFISVCQNFASVSLIKSQKNSTLDINFLCFFVSLVSRQKSLPNFTQNLLRNFTWLILFKVNFVTCLNCTCKCICPCEDLTWETHSNFELDKDSEIDSCQEYKYLGVIFDTSGTDD